MAKKKIGVRKKTGVKARVGKAPKASKKARRASVPAASVFEKKAASLLGRLWTQPEFKAAFISNPTEVLRGEGFDVPQGVQVSVKEDTADIMHVVIPRPPEKVTVKEIGRRLEKACRTCLCFTGATGKGN